MNPKSMSGMEDRSRRCAGWRGDIRADPQVQPYQGTRGEHPLFGGYGGYNFRGVAGGSFVVHT